MRGKHTPDKGDKRAFGIRLYNLLKTDKTQFKDFAKQIGVTPSWVTNVTKGIAFPSVATMIKMCDALHVTPNYMLGYTESHNTRMRTADKDKLMEVYESLADYLFDSDGEEKAV